MLSQSLPIGGQPSILFDRTTWPAESKTTTVTGGKLLSTAWQIAAFAMDSAVVRVIPFATYLVTLLIFYLPPSADDEMEHRLKIWQFVVDANSPYQQTPTSIKSTTATLTESVYFRPNTFSIQFMSRSFCLLLSFTYRLKIDRGNKSLSCNSLVF